MEDLINAIRYSGIHELVPLVRVFVTEKTEGTKGAGTIVGYTCLPTQEMLQRLKCRYGTATRYNAACIVCKIGVVYDAIATRFKREIMESCYIGDEEVPPRPNVWLLKGDHDEIYRYVARLVDDDERTRSSEEKNAVCMYRAQHRGNEGLSQLVWV